MDVVETHSRRFGFRELEETGNGWRRNRKLNNINSEDFLVLHLKNSLSAIEREGPSVSQYEIGHGNSCQISLVKRCVRPSLPDQC